MESSRHDGLAQLHQRYYPELVRLAFALTGDWSLAEELGQEAFVRAWRNWGSIHRQQQHRQPDPARDEQAVAAQARVGSSVLLGTRRLPRRGIWQSHANFTCLLLILRAIRCCCIVALLSVHACC